METLNFKIIIECERQEECIFNFTYPEDSTKNRYEREMEYIDYIKMFKKGTRIHVSQSKNGPSFFYMNNKKIPINFQKSENELESEKKFFIQYTICTLNRENFNRRGEDFDGVLVKIICDKQKRRIRNISTPVLCQNWINSETEIYKYLQNNCNKLFDSVRNKLERMLIEGNSPWIPYDGFSIKYYALCSMLLINSLEIEEVIVVDKYTMPVIKKISEVQYITNIVNNSFNNEIHIIQNDNMPNRVTNRIEDEQIATLMGMYTIIDDYEQLKHLRKQFGITDSFSNTGKYIFICLDNINKFSRLFDNEKLNYFENKKFKNILESSRVFCPIRESENEQILLKLTLLHEFGHALFSEISTYNFQRREAETKANWAASLILKNIEKDCIFIKTRLQPYEYKFFVSLIEETEWKEIYYSNSYTVFDKRNNSKYDNYCDTLVNIF